MEKLKDGVIYGNLGDINFKFNVETLFEIIDGLTYDEEDDYDQECECEQDCDSECSSKTLSKCYEHVLKNTLNSNDYIVAFKYNRNEYVADRRECIGECLGVFYTGAEAERKLELPRNIATKIANTWMHAIETGETSINDTAATNGLTPGQWTTYSTNNHRVMLCYSSSLHDLLITDEPKKSLVSFHF